MSNTVNVKSCPPSGNGLYGMGAFMKGIAETHGQVNKVTDKEFIEDVTRKITHLTGDQLKCLNDFLEKSCRIWANACEDDYCKEDAYEDQTRARAKYDDVNEKFSRSDLGVAMDEALDELGDHEDRYDKNAAHTDSMNEVRHIFEDYEKEMLPKIMNKQCQFGIYNDTTTQLLLNNAYAETVVKAATLVLNTMQNYEKLVLEATGIKFNGMRDFMNHVYHMTDLQMNSIHKYFEHAMGFADLVLKGLQVAVSNESTDVLDRDLTEHIEEEVVHGLNLGDWATDMAIVAIGVYLMQEFLFHETKCTET